MTLSIIVATSENNIIGRDNSLIWHLSADLKRFKALTSGHTIIMGRKTFQSIGKALPNRQNIVISRTPGFQAEGCTVVPDIQEALNEAASQEQVFIIGGGSLYREFWHKADYLHLTLVHTVAEGDTTIPPVDLNEWKEVSRQDFKADEKNEFDYSFIDYERR